MYFSPVKLNISFSVHGTAIFPDHEKLQIYVLLRLIVQLYIYVAICKQKHLYATCLADVTVKSGPTKSVRK